MTKQNKSKDLVTVNGIPAAQGLVELAQSVLEFDRLNREFNGRMPGQFSRDGIRHRRDALDRAYRAMVAKSAIVTPLHLTQIVRSNKRPVRIKPADRPQA